MTPDGIASPPAPPEPEAADPPPPEPAASVVVRVPAGSDLAAVVALLRDRFDIPAPAAPADALDPLLAHVRAAVEARTRAAYDECMAMVKRGEKPPPDLAALAQTHGPGVVALLDGPPRDVLFAGPVAGFAPADLAFDALNLTTLADPKQQRYVAKLKANAQNDRAIAAALLTDAVAGFAPAAATPADELSRVRAQLATDGREVVLLFDTGTPADAPLLAALSGPASAEEVVFRIAVAAAESVGAAEPTLPEPAPAVEPAEEPLPPAAPVEEPPPLAEEAPGPVEEPPPPVEEPVTPIEEPPADAAPEPRPAAEEVGIGEPPAPDPRPEAPDVLDDVTRFLAAADSPDGAPLGLLTDAVLAWLRMSGRFDTYRIRR